MTSLQSLHILEEIQKGFDTLETLSIIKESPRNYIQHDLLYKELLHTFFEEFLEVFFPDVHGSLDFHEFQPLSEEVHTDVLKGSTRRLDIVIETKLKDTDVVVIVHVEPQSYSEDNFHERMFQYYSLLYNKYRKPIIPIAVFSYEEKWKEDTFTIEFPFLKVLSFKYKVLHLKSKHWRDYIESDYPVAAALLSEMGYDESERVEVKKEFLRMIVRMELDPARQRLIYGFFETYLKLTEKEEEKVMEEVRKLPEADRILELPISYEEKGKEIGKELGRKETMEQVVLEMLQQELDDEIIIKVTKLNEDEINEIRKQM